MINFDGQEDVFHGVESQDAKFPERCPDCGTSNPDNAASCPNCEKQFESVSPEDAESDGPEGTTEETDSEEGPLANPEAGGHEKLD